ncbi:hypothetical protein GCM10009718_06050 [Isoptericola halotolerans]
MASGSHAWNGNCADFVNAATATRTAITAANVGSWDHTGSSRMALSWVVPVRTEVAMTAPSRHSPPPTVTRNVRTAGA